MKKPFFIFLISINVLSVDVLHSKKSHSIAYEMLEDARLYNSHVFSDYDFLFQFHFNHVKDPLVRKTLSNLKQVDSIVNDLSSFHIGGAVYLNKKLMLGLQTYFGLFNYEYYQPGSAINSSKIKGKSSGLSDVILDLKWRILSKERYGIALMPFLRIPTGGGEIPIRIFSPGSSNFQDINHKVLSEDSFGYGARFVYERYFDFMNLVLNLGYIQADGAILGELDLRKKLSLGVGAYVPLGQKVGLNLEWLRYFSLPFNSNQNPNELYAGLSVGLKKNLVGFAGVAFGNILTESDGNDYRLSAGLKFFPRTWSEERKAIKLINNTEKKDLITECKKPYIFEKSNKVTVRFPHNIGDIYDSRDLSDVIQRIKNRVIDISNIQINGHTSRSGSDEYNLILSKKRSDSVKRVLVDNGIDESIITTFGLGESELLDQTVSKVADIFNRRVEFLITLKKRDGYYCEKPEDFLIK